MRRDLEGRLARCLLALVAAAIAGTLAYFLPLIALNLAGWPGGLTPWHLMAAALVPVVLWMSAGR